MALRHDVEPALPTMSADTYFANERPEVAALLPAGARHVLEGTWDEVEAQISTRHFDLAVRNDGIEHMAEPEAVLASLKTKRVAGTMLVGSVPNVHHLPHEAEMLWEQDWRYREAWPGSPATRVCGRPADRAQRHRVAVTLAGQGALVADPAGAGGADLALAAGRAPPADRLSASAAGLNCPPRLHAGPARVQLAARGAPGSWRSVMQRPDNPGLAGEAIPLSHSKAHTT